MALRRYGYGDAQSAVDTVNPVAKANRVEYRRGPLTEWYVNGPLGLEQGFTIRERLRPELRRANHGQRQTTSASMLTIALALTGDLAVRVDRESKSLTLINTLGSPTLRYTGLGAHDAKGNELLTWMEVRGGELRLRVDDAGALYPVVFDPVVQLAELTASDGASSDDFGASAAISGDTVVVGAPEGYPEVSGPGAIYIFVRPSNGWANMTQTAKLTASDGVTGDLLGSSVSIDGGTIVAGAPNAAVGSNQLQGAVYLFVEPAGGWVDMTETAKLTASDGAYQDNLGLSTSISGNTVVAGAPGANSLSGAAYVFVKPPSGWADMSQRAKLTTSEGQADGELGWSVSVSGKTIAAGAPAIINTLFPGAAYVYVRPASGWANTTQTGTLTASDGQAGDRLGYSVAIDGDTVLAGAPFATTFGQPGSEQGAAYVFVEPSSGWTNGTQTAKLTAGNGQVGDQLGRSVSMSIKAAVAGAWRANNLQGRVYVYLKPPN
ncbi:MAG TPA: FG-GAP repeat protein, partial [Terriglobales bacterium]